MQPRRCPDKLLFTETKQTNSNGTNERTAVNVLQERFRRVQNRRVTHGGSTITSAKPTMRTDPPSASVGQRSLFRFAGFSLLGVPKRVLKILPAFGRNRRRHPTGQVRLILAILI
jgi:hypothetical protein